MAKKIEAWQYGELTFLGVASDGEVEPVTKFTARVGGKEPVHGTDVDQFAVMDTFGTRGWRLKLVEELTAPAETERQSRVLDALSHTEKVTGTPGTVVSLTRYAMARRTS